MNDLSARVKGGLWHPRRRMCDQRGTPLERKGWTVSFFSSAGRTACASTKKSALHPGGKSWVISNNQLIRRDARGFLDQEVIEVKA